MAGPICLAVGLLGKTTGIFGEIYVRQCRTGTSNLGTNLWTSATSSVQMLTSAPPKMTYRAEVNQNFKTVCRSYRSEVHRAELRLAGTFV